MWTVLIFLENVYSKPYLNQQLRFVYFPQVIRARAQEQIA